MTEFAYNNIKTANIGHTFLKLNYRYYSKALNKKDINSHLWLKLADRLLTQLRNPTNVYKKKLSYMQKLHQQNYNKHVKPRNYIPGKKV